MMDTCLRAIALIALVLLTSCGGNNPAPAKAPATPTEDLLTGDVFVVTRGGQNIKLALVTVGAIRETELAPIIEPFQTRIESDAKALETSLAAARDELASAKRKYERAGRDVDQVATECAAAHRPIKDCAAEIGRARDRMETGPGVQRRLAQKNFDRAKSESDSFSPSELLFSLLPSPVATAKTNADGRFEMNLPTSGKYALAATASRAVAGDTERYYWLVWVPLDGAASKHVMLANDNLTTSGSSESAVTLSR